MFDSDIWKISHFTAYLNVSFSLVRKPMVALLAACHTLQKYTWDINVSLSKNVICCLINTFIYLYIYECM